MEISNNEMTLCEPLEKVISYISKKPACWMYIYQPEPGKFTITSRKRDATHKPVYTANPVVNRSSDIIAVAEKLY